MDYGNKKVSVAGLQTFYPNLDGIHYPVTALLSSSKFPQNLKETKITYRCILKHDSPSKTLRRVAKTRCMKELGKGCLHTLPARPEKDLRYFHWRAQQRTEQKVLGHLLKQTLRGQIQSRKQMGIKRFWVQLFVLVMHYFNYAKLATTLDCSFSGCFNVTLVCSHPRDGRLKRFGLLVQIILSKKQQDTGDLLASVVLGARE